MSLWEDPGGSTLPGTAPLRPFLCSVPEDLQQEREYLRTQVFPHLDSLCRARGTCFRPVDPRWSRKGEGKMDGAGDRDGGEGEGDGGEGEGEKEREIPPHRRHTISSQQLKISLDLVGHAPFFLCMLGYRYGQCRPEEAPPLPVAEEEGGGGQPSPLERNLYTAGRGGYPWVLQGRNQTCSFAELLVTQALLTHPPGTCFFYFRDYSFGDEEEEGAGGERSALLLRVWSSQSEYERRRMRELKARIVDGCLPVRFFRSLPELGHLVRTDWIRIIDQLYPLNTHYTGLGQPGLFEHWCHEGRIEHLCRTFVPWPQAEQVLESLDSFALSAALDLERQTTAALQNQPEIQLNKEGHKSILLVCGARGCGKSTLVAWWLQKFRRKNPALLIIPQFPGLCPSSSDIRSALRRITFLLRQAHYGSQAGWSERVEERVELGPLPLAVQAFSAAAALGPCVLVLDGLDQLTQTLSLSAQQVKELQWLPEALPTQCKLIITTCSTDLSYTSLARRQDVQVLSCPGQSEPVVRQSVLLRHLGLPDMKVPGSLLQSIVGKKPALLPISLAVLGWELRTCGVTREEEEEEELFERYLWTETLPELWALVIRRWTKDYGWTVETRTKKRKMTLPYTPAPVTPDYTGWVWDVLCLLHLSRSGLGKEELLHLLKLLGYCGAQRVLPQHWALFRSATGPWIQERPDGQLTLTHQSLSQAVELLLLKAGGRSRKEYRRVLLQGFQNRDGPTRNQARVLEEVAWGLEQSKAWEDLHILLTDPNTIEFLSRSPDHFKLKTDVVRYWGQLAQEGYDPVTSVQRLLALGQPCAPQDSTGSITGVFGSGDGDGPSRKTFVTEVQGHGGEYSHLQEPEVKGRLMAFSAEVLFCLGKVLEAEQALLEMEALLKQAAGPEGGATVALLQVQCSLTELCLHLYRPDRAQAHCRRALECVQFLTATQPEATEDAPQTRGQLLSKLCQLLLTIGCADEVPGILEEIAAVNHARTHPCAEATVTFLLGLNELLHGCASAAESCFRAALASRRRWYGPDHQLVAEVEEQLADVLQEHCRETEVGGGEAAELYRHVIRVKGQEAGLHTPTSPLARPIGCSVAVTLVKLAKLLLGDGGRGDRREAVALLERAFDQRVRLLGPDHRLTRKTGGLLRSEVSRSGRPRGRPVARSTLSRQRAQTAKNSRSRLPGNKEEKDQSCVAAATPSPILNRNLSQNPSWSAQRPRTACLTSVFGPGSSISDLDPAPRAGSPDRVLHKCAWFHLPGRYPTQHPERQLHPPRRISRRERWTQSANMITHRKTQPDTTAHPEKQQRPDTPAHPEKQQRPNTTAHPEKQQRPNMTAHPEKQQRPNTTAHPEKQQRLDTTAHPEKQQRPNMTAHPEKQQRPDTTAHPEKQQRPNMTAHPEKQQRPDTPAHPEKQQRPNMTAHPEKQQRPDTTAHPEKQQRPNTTAHPEKQQRPNTTAHPEKQQRPNTTAHPEKQQRPNTTAHPEKQQRPNTTAHPEKQQRPNMTAHPEKQQRPNTTAHPEKQQRPNTTAHPEKHQCPNTTTHPEKQQRPNTTAHPEKQQRPNTTAHPEKQQRPNTTAHPEKQQRPNTTAHPEKQQRPNTTAHPEKQQRPNMTAHPEKQQRPNTTAHPEKQQRPNTTAHPEKHQCPNTTTHPEKQQRPNTTAHPEKQQRPNTTAHPEKQQRPNTTAHPEKQQPSNTTAHPEKQQRPNTTAHPEKQQRPDTTAHPEKQQRPNTTAHPEKQQRPNTTAHPEKQQRPNTTAHPEKHQCPNTTTHPEKQQRPNTTAHPEKQQRPNTTAHPEKQQRPNTTAHPEKQQPSNTTAHPEKQQRPNTTTHPEKQQPPNTTAHPEKQQRLNTTAHPEKQQRPNTTAHPEKQQRPNTTAHPEKQQRPNTAQH